MALAVTAADLGQAVKDVGHLHVLALLVVAAQLQHQVLHVRLERLFGHVLNNLRHAAREARGTRRGIQGVQRELHGAREERQIRARDVRRLQARLALLLGHAEGRVEQAHAAGDHRDLQALLLLEH